MSVVVHVVCDDVKYRKGSARGPWVFTDGEGKTIHSDTGDGASATFRRKLTVEVADKLGAIDTAEDIERLMIHKLDELRQRAAADPGGETRAGSYLETPDGLVLLKTTRDGDLKVPLTNFIPRILASITKDDGAERQQLLEMTVAQRGRISPFTIPTDEFAQMNWPIKYAGPGAIIFAGASTRDHVRVATQVFSADATARVVYAHTGWRVVADQLVYLHGGGAIGAAGPVTGIDVELPGPLSRYVLPAPPSGVDLRQCIRASLRLLDLAPDRITFPVVASVYRSIFGSVDFAVFLVGPSGVFKSELAALAAQHFGAGLDARHLPGSWTSTDNALEGLSHAAKDTIFPVDDFAPAGPPNEIQKLHMKGDRIIRGAGNGSGKGRMNANGSLRATKNPRCTILSTGEELVRGQSVRARTFAVEISPNDIDVERLTRCQTDAAEGLYAGAMAGFLKWRIGQVAASGQVPTTTKNATDDSANAVLEPDWQERSVFRAIEGDIHGMRALSTTSSESHRRTPHLIANLGVGLRQFLQFAVFSQTITDEEMAALWRRGWIALGAGAAEQQILQAANEPAKRFMELVGAAVASGNAHVAGVDGKEPRKNPGGWGWRESTGTNIYGSSTNWDARGDRIGWVEGEHLFLEPDAS